MRFIDAGYAITNEGKGIHLRRVCFQLGRRLPYLRAFRQENTFNGSGVGGKSGGLGPLLRAAGRLKIVIGIARVGVVVGERVAMLEEIFDGLDGNGKTES